MKEIVENLFSNERLIIQKSGFHVDLVLMNLENGKEYTSRLPTDDHLNKRRVIDCIEFMRKENDKI